MKGQNGFKTVFGAVACLVLSACGLVESSLPTTGVASRGAGAPEIKVLSNRADLISGGDALVEVVPSATKVELNGKDITSAFALRPNGRYMGLVTGLALGPNVLTAQIPGGGGQRITITNHPTGGPVFSGPQIQPWYCLAGAEDAQCNRPTTFTYQYKSSATGQFAPYDPASPPVDVAETTTDQGKTVPYIVRVETGNMDRSQYRIAVLAEPGETWTPWTGPSAWNHKVYVTHGAGCGTGHSEGAAPNVLNDSGLKRGFAVMSTALEDNTENCNVVVQAESVMMAKEHLIETYGEIRYLFGVGSSGGAIAQNQMANAYPGLYNGIILSQTFPDFPVLDLLDCEVLLRYWNDPTRWGAGVVWTEPQQAAAAGLASTSVCRDWKLLLTGTFDPKAGVSCDVPDHEPALLYKPDTNPTGVRCTWQDYHVNLFGLRPPERWGAVEKQIGRGFANRPYDNVGLQYGLRALMARTITPTQFADLNAKIGGVDIDFDTQATRIEGDPAAIRAAYRSGTLNEANNLDRIPIIDKPWFPGDRYEIHDNYKSWALRIRLDAANGHHDNHIIWYGPNDQNGDFDVMNDWLAAVEADTSALPVEEKVVKNKPAAARDRCETPDRTVCDQVFGPAGSIRWGAGQPTVVQDVIKCQLKPLVRSDYHPILFTDSEWAQLESAFPTGVCDWSKPGVDQQPGVPWLTYQDGPGGQPLPPPPVSEPAN